MLFRSVEQLVKGRDFIALHELFDGINEEVEDYVDDMAERAVQLGGVAEGTARMVAKRSTLGEYPANAVGGPGSLAERSCLGPFDLRAQAEVRNLLRTDTPTHPVVLSGVTTPRREPRAESRAAGPATGRIRLHREPPRRLGSQTRKARFVSSMNA